MDLEAVVNATLDNYLVYVNITEANVEHVLVSNDKIGLKKREFMLD